jgi:hypothetical protein
MAKKPRSQRRNNKGGAAAAAALDNNKSKNSNSNSNGNSTTDDAADYLSESHTILTVGENDDSITGGFFDDGWELGDDDVDNTPNENDLRAAEARYQKLSDSLATIDDFMGEKRSSKREGLLRQWFQALTQYASNNSTTELVDNRRDDLIQACKYALRNGSPSEQYAACRVLEAAAVLIADDAYFEQIRQDTMRVVQSTHRAIPVRTAALRAMGMAVFMGVDDDVITEELLDLCEALAQDEYRRSSSSSSGNNNTHPSALRATALDVWTFLATTIHELYIAGKDDVSTGRGLLLLPLLLECLEQDKDMSLRAAAGECVAWIHTARVELGINDEDGDNTTERKYAEGSWEGSDWEDIMAEIESCMEALSNQSGHYMSKKAKKGQRATFREYLATLQENESPTHVVQFRGGSLELSAWKDIIALNFTRRCLQGGFQIQLLTNPTLQAVFGTNSLALNSDTGYSQLEKRLLLSKSSVAAKIKDADRNKKQRNRTNAKNHFLTVDGDDI